MAFSNIYGDYEVRMPMTGLAEVYLERAAFLKIGSTPACITSLSAEARILCDLAGVPGVP
uniref:Uncharacterized protein n=1 Tax=Coccidioides posadasii RMSCC 3488 TaxID=454284 RepID=A0A0J6IHH5_COCPO|nr:hypothetical protein CPAG_07584 [Coccidioides posadasii RMSCC 3488]